MALRRLWSDTEALVAVNGRYADRGPWIRQPRYVILAVAIVLAATFLIAGGMSLHDLAQARGSDPELKRFEATIRDADLLIAELRVMESYHRQFIQAAIGIDPGEQRLLVRPLVELHSLASELREELPRIKLRGAGIGMAEEKMARLRRVFNRLCRLAKVPCYQTEPAKKPSSRRPGGKLSARFFSCRNAELPYNSFVRLCSSTVRTEHS